MSVRNAFIFIYSVVIDAFHCLMNHHLIVFLHKIYRLVIDERRRFAKMIFINLLLAFKVMCIFTFHFISRWLQRQLPRV